jgi:hypothetical protein
MDDLRVFNAPISSSKAKEIYFAGLSSLLINSNIDIKEYREKINSIATNE